MAKPNPHFFEREPDGSVRIRLRLSSEEASLIEEAAGDTPLVAYMHHVLNERARHHVEQARKERAKVLTAPTSTGGNDG